MKRSSLALLCSLLLSGCIFDPVFDTSNFGAYQTLPFAYDPAIYVFSLQGSAKAWMPISRARRLP